MKYLVTGGAGFIGSNFILYMLGEHPDCEIVNLDKLTYAGNLENLKSVASHPNYRFVKGDIADPKAVDEVIEGVDVVVNFAAETHVDRSILGPADFIQTNVVGTQVLLDAAVKHKIERFHHISTDEVFGSLPLNVKQRFNERTLYNPSSPYSASKAASDHLVRAYYHTYGLPITITNCSNNYGPYQFPEKFIPLMMINAMQDKKLPIYGDGANIRDWIYVEDHSRAVDSVLKHGVPGETYLIGGNSERSNLSVARQILDILGKSENLLEFVKDRPGHDRRYAIDSSKIEIELKFKLNFNFNEGLRDTLEWYRKNQTWWEPLLKKNQAYYQKQYGND